MNIPSSSPSPKKLPPIAYLAPEIPALSATFVYEEIYALEERGIRVIPFSVRSPGASARGHEGLARRTTVLYGWNSAWASLLGWLGVLRRPGGRSALSLLRSDFRKLGGLSIPSMKLLFQFGIASRFSRLLLTSKCVHLHVHFAHVPTQIAMYASAMSGITFTFVGHANDLFQRPLLLREKAERSARFVTISDFNRRYLEKIGVPAGKIAVVRCGVDLPPARAFTRKAFGSSGKVRIGSLGRLVEKKGMDVLIDVVSMLVSRGHEVEVEIAGDGPAKSTLQTRILDLGLSPRVALVGPLDHSRVLEWLSSIDIFVLACRMDKNGDMDGIPVVLMEAMATGIPVVSTRLSGIPELVIDGETGVLVEPNDRDDLVRGIESLIRSSCLRKAVSEKAGKYVNQEFGRPGNITKLLEVFSVALGLTASCHLDSSKFVYSQQK